MNTCAHLRHLALCGLLVAGLGPLPSVASVASAPGESVQRLALTRAADPAGTVYIYRGDFTASVTHSVFVDWQGGDSEQVDASATIRGTIPEIRQQDDGSMTSAGAPGTVEVVSAVGTGITRARAGQYVDTCKATIGSISPAPFVVNTDSAGNKLIPFPYLTLPAKCTDTDGRTTTTSFGYGPVEAYIQRMAPGTSEANLDFIGGWDASQSEDEEASAEICPRFIPGQTPRCKYVVEGKLHLTLVKKIVPPTKPTPEAPKGATISPGATKLGAGILCKKNCVVTMSVVTLKGGRQVIAPRILRPKPGRVVNVKVTIPANKRALVKRAGGVKVRLSYKVAGQKKYTEIRKARL